MVVFLLILSFGLCVGQFTDIACFVTDTVQSCADIRKFPTSFKPNIESILIHGMDVPSIPPDLSNKVQRLSSFTVYGGKIGRIATGAFSNLQNVNEISFFNSKIEIIESNAFSNIKNIYQIFFYNSTVGEVRENGFSNIQNLTNFVVSLSRIRVIRQHAVNMVTYIENFRIQDSHFELFEKQGLYNIGRMKNFLIHDNTFKLFKCMSIEPLIAVANQSSFYRNLFSCSCDLQWMVRDQVTHTYLYSNWCHEKGNNISLDNYDFKTLGCANVSDICDESFKFTIPTSGIEIVPTTTKMSDHSVPTTTSMSDHSVPFTTTISQHSLPTTTRMSDHSVLSLSTLNEQTISSSKRGYSVSPKIDKTVHTSRQSTDEVLPTSTTLFSTSDVSQKRSTRSTVSEVTSNNTLNPTTLTTKRMTNKDRDTNSCEKFTSDFRSALMTMFLLLYSLS